MACDHCVSSGCKHVNCSKQDLTAESKVSRAALWKLAGTTLMEKTILLKPAQLRSNRSATWGSGTSPSASRMRMALATRASVCLLQNASSPMGPPSNSKFPSCMTLKSAGNMLTSTEEALPPVRMSSHLSLLRGWPELSTRPVLRTSPISAQRVLSCLTACAATVAVPPRQRNLQHDDLCDAY